MGWMLVAGHTPLEPDSDTSPEAEPADTA